MVRQHQENHRQRQVIVVRRPLLGDLAILRVGHAAGLEVGHHHPLIGHDDHEHIRTHDRGGERPQMQQRRPARKHRGIEIRHPHQHRKQRHHQHRLVRLHEHLAQPVIDHPTERQRSQRNRHRLPHRKVRHRRVDQEHLGPEVIHQHQHREAAQPGGVTLPFEPGQMLGQHRRGHEVLVDVIEPAAVHLPLLAMRQGRQAGRLAQAEVQRDKVETRSDPGNRGDHMQPAHPDLDPLPQHDPVIHGTRSPVRLPRGYASGPPSANP